MSISVKAEEGATTNTANAVIATGSENIYQVAGGLSVTADAVGDKDKTATVNGVEYTYDASISKTTTSARAFTVNGGSMIVDVDGKLTIAATAEQGETRNFAQGMAVDDTTIKVHTTGAIDIKARHVDGDLPNLWQRIWL